MEVFDNKESTKKIAKYFLVILNLGILVFYKSLKFIPDSTWGEYEILIPIGLSYFIFEQLSYIFDYQGSYSDSVSWFEYLTSSIFFAKITSGPIERLSTFSKRIRPAKTISKSEFKLALMLLYWGLIKKFVVADNIDRFGLANIDSGRTNGYILWATVLLSKYEVWANFSGYTDMARGIAKFYGIDLLENFKHPFNSVSIKEYWKKWHISLSEWIRDYVFYPLVTTRLSILGVNFLVTITFVVFGLWHEFSLNFIIYGVIQGILISMSDIFTPTIEKHIQKISSANVKDAINFFRKIYLYVFLVSLPSVFFETKTLADAKGVFKGLIDFSPNLSLFYEKKFMAGILPAIIYIILIEYVEYKRETNSADKVLPEKGYLFEVFKYTILVFFFLYCARMVNSVEFLYKKY